MRDLDELLLPKAELDHCNDRLELEQIRTAAIQDEVQAWRSHDAPAHAHRCFQLTAKHNELVSLNHRIERQRLELHEYRMVRA